MGIRTHNNHSDEFANWRCKLPYSVLIYSTPANRSAVPQSVCRLLAKQDEDFGLYLPISKQWPVVVPSNRGCFWLQSQEHYRLFVVPLVLINQQNLLGQHKGGHVLRHFCFNFSSCLTPPAFEEFNEGWQVKMLLIVRDCLICPIEFRLPVKCEVCKSLN